LTINDGGERALCPRCAGGTSGEHSLSIRYAEDGVISLKCFRATCGFFGFTLLDPNAEFSRKRVKQATPYREPTRPLDKNVQATLSVDFGLDFGEAQRHGWRLTEDRRTLVLPIRDPYGGVRGHITRTLYETPKRVYTYKATAQPWLDWWFEPMNSAPVVVVEDVLSACRLSGLGYNAVALLGTGMSQDQAKEIQTIADGRDVYIALDRDAFEKAIKHKTRHAHILDVTGVVCLTEDIKNMADDDDIRSLFDGRNTTTRGGMREQKSL
jgi:DNA primase